MFTYEQFRSLITDGINKAINKSDILKKQDEMPKSFNGRKSVAQILRESFTSSPEIISSSEIVIWFFDCRENLRKTLFENNYPASLADILVNSIEDNLQSLMGIETWLIYFPWGKSSKKELQNA